jgi:hypothetical protein
MIAFRCQVSATNSPMDAESPRSGTDRPDATQPDDVTLVSRTQGLLTSAGSVDPDCKLQAQQRQNYPGLAIVLTDPSADSPGQDRRFSSLPSTLPAVPGVC